jgi:hypothetical protein
LQDVPPLPLPDAPSATVTNSKVALALIAPPSPVSTAPHSHAGGTNLFQDGAEKHHSNLPLMGFSPAKNKGGRVASSGGCGRRTRSDGISPCNPFDVLNDNALEACDNDSNNNKDDATYLPTPMYKKIGQVACKPKKRVPKVVLDGSYFTFLHPLTFNTKQFSRGHPQVYSQEEMRQFDADFQKQLSFNFCATCATRRSQRQSTRQRIALSCLVMC